MSEADELSPSGDPILRHQGEDREWEVPQESGRNLEDLQDHVEKYLGPIETVFHEMMSDRVHLDVLFVPATDERPFHVLVTSGVSDLPMTVPEGAEGFSRAELMIALPGSWPMTHDSFKDEAVYWPIRWLKSVGRLPHDYNTWIGWGHTIPNGDPPSAIANTEFTGMLLVPPYWLDQEFFQFESSSGDTVTLYDMVPLYTEEMEFKLHRGAEELEELLGESGVYGVLDVTRPNVAVE